MGLSDNITITRSETYKGTAYVLIGSLASFPGELESVINPSTYAVTAGLVALCPTTEDGVTVGRTAEVSDGIAIDQKSYNLDEGEPTGWAQTVGFTMLNTDVDFLKYVWATDDPVSVVGSVVNQKRLPLGAPTSFTERELYIVQEDITTKRLRVFAFRKAVPQTDSELNAQSEEAAGASASFKCRADTTLADHHGPFGFIFEEDPA
jgi:hypothetical protein